MPRSCNDSIYLQLIYEYLLHMGLERTATSLKEECRTCEYPLPEEIIGVRRCDISNLLQYFDSEDEAAFMRIMNISIPPESRTSYEGKKIMADLLVYFAALSLLKDGYDQKAPWMKPLVHVPPSILQHCKSPSVTTLMPHLQGSHSHTSTNSETLQPSEICKCCGQKSCTCENEPTELIPKQRASHGESAQQRQIAYPCMQALADFLEGECSNLRDDPYFIHYFNLPFTASPQTHFQYKHIFQGTWPKNLRRRLWDFLVHHRQAAGLPGLVRLLPSCEVHVENF